MSDVYDMVESLMEAGLGERGVYYFDRRHYNIYDGYIYIYYIKQ